MKVTALNSSCFFFSSMTFTYLFFNIHNIQFIFNVLHTINCLPEWILRAHIPSNILLSSSPWAYAGFANGGELSGGLGEWHMPRSVL